MDFPMPEPCVLLAGFGVLGFLLRNTLLTYSNSIQELTREVKALQQAVAEMRGWDRRISDLERDVSSMRRRPRSR